MTFSSNAFASLNLTAGPVDGSTVMRFGRVSLGQSNKQQIKVHVTSTDGKQYRVFQRLRGAITNEKLENLDQQAIETQGDFNSNAGGSLLSNIERLGFGDQLIYTSGASGEGDIFVVNYSVRPELVNVSGNLSGWIVFTAVPIGAASQGSAQVEVSLDNASSWVVKAQGGHSPKVVRVKDSDTTEKTADFAKISFSGNAGQTVRIYQEMDAMLQSEMGQELTPGALRFFTAGDLTQNLRVSDATDLGLTRTLLYSGDKEEDSFLVYYLVDADKIQNEDAGSYRGRVKYIVETDKGPEELQLDLECQIQPAFTMDLEMPPEGVSFAKVLPTNPPEDREVTVKVRSNLHKPYQVLQGLQAPMANEKGDELKKEFFRMKVEVPPGQGGQTKYSDFLSVESGEYPVFSSDAQGSPATFKVVYRLQGYPQMSPGNFLASIKFSLNQN